MLFSEWKYVLHTKGMFKIILGILLVPTFYAVIFLASLWNPYTKVNHLPVGIVDEDVSVVRNNQRYTLGKSLTKQLVRDHSADFQQISASKAATELKNGKLYMAITIPNNFSKNATLLGSSNAQKIRFNYHTNAGFSFIAMKMNTTTAEKVQTSVDKQLTASYLKTMNNALSKAGINLTTSGNALTQTTTGLGKIATGENVAAKSAGQVATGANSISTGLSQVTGGIQKSNQSLAMIPENDTHIQDALAGLDQTITSKSTAVNQSASLSQQATAENQEIRSDLNQKTPDLTVVRNTENQLQATLSALKDQNDQVSADNAAVTAEVQQVGKSAATNTVVATGLMAGNKQGLTALNSISTGVNQVGSATNKLATGSSQLANNTAIVKSDDTKIANGIAAGGKQLANAGTSTTKHIDTIVNPITLTHTDHTHVKNNGTGMSPYLMSVALFVGSITFNIIYDMFTPHKKPKNAFEWWGQKIPFLLEFTFLAATTMFILLCTVNHLTPLQPWKTYAFVILTMWTFGSIVTFFNLILGKTGAWFMLIFMIIQLGGSAGTYPIQLSNHIFQIIHPYLPMSISIDAFRSTLSIGNSIMPETLIFVAIIVVFNLLMLLTFELNMSKSKQLVYKA